MTTPTRFREVVVAIGVDEGWSGGGAPTSATYVTLTTNGTLTSERVLTAGHGVDLVDAGAGSTVTVDVDETELTHATLGAGMAWTSSGHTGTASRVAAFGGGGAAAELQVGVDIQAYSATLAAIAAGTWTGATSITTLGTIATGTWQGTVIGAAYLGSGSTGGLDQWQRLCADGVWRIGGGPTVASVSKTSDTTLSTTGLTMSGLPIGTYHLQIFSVHTGNATGGIKIQMVTTNGTCRWRAADRDGGTVVNTESSTPNYSVSAGEQAIVIDGWVSITSSTGTIDLHMAQNSSNATPTTIVRATMTLTETS